MRFVAIRTSMSRFLSSSLVIRVPFFLLVGFNKGVPQQNGQEGTTQEPRCYQRVLSLGIQFQVRILGSWLYGLSLSGSFVLMGLGFRV